MAEELRSHIDGIHFAVNSNYRFPYYRIVAADSRSPRDGRFIETVGSYDPTAKPAAVKIDETMAIKWLHDGAIPTDTVRSLLSHEGIMKKFHEQKMTSKKNNKKESA